MLFGHNSNVEADGTTYHVQTEDRGTTNALIDTTVYFHGRVLHRRTNNYFDLLPLNPAREETLKRRLDAQHRAVIEELRSGTLRLPLPQDEPVSAPAALHGSKPASGALSLELLNAKTWLTGKRAALLVAVRNEAHQAVGGATVIVRVDGAAEAAKFTAQTGDFGQTQLEFDMPKLASAEAALVIEASKGNANGHLRFQLRGKPRVPSAS
jgi:hypothetical protein